MSRMFAFISAVVTAQQSVRMFVVYWELLKVVGFCGYMLAKSLAVFYVWSPYIFVLFLYQNSFSGTVYSIMPNKTLTYHTLTVVKCYM